MSDDDIFQEMQSLLSSTESSIRKIAGIYLFIFSFKSFFLFLFFLLLLLLFLGHILLEIAQDNENCDKIILSGCLPFIIQNINDVHCGIIMATLLFKLSFSKYLPTIFFQNQLFR